MNHRTRHAIGRALLALGMTLPALAIAGDLARSELLPAQLTTTAGGAGDHLLVRQDGANNVFSAWQAEDTCRAVVRQSGASNSAKLTQDGIGGTVDLVQDGMNNRADIVQAGAGNAASVYQLGDANFARIEQRGAGASARITQLGSGKIATIIQY